MQTPIAALVIASTSALFSQTAAADQSAAFLTQPLVFNAAENSAQPSVVADSKRGQFVLSWQSKDAAGCSALKLATLKPGAKLSAISQAGQGCNWFVNWADFPSVGIADNGDWLTYWLQKSADSAYAYDIHMVRSSNQGSSWQPPFKINSDNTQTEHGFVSLAPAGGDKMLAVWLDGRKMASETAAASDPHANHGSAEHAHGDAMTLRSAVIGSKGSMSPEMEIDANVCSCCNTDLARTGAGTKSMHTLVFRDRSDAEIRDIGLAHFSNGAWKSEGVIHADNWKIAGCPVNGPAIATHGNDTLVVWATMQGDALSVRARSLMGKPGEFLNLETSAGVLGRVDAAPWGKSNWLVSWLGAGKAGRATLYLAELDEGLKIIRQQALLDLPAGRNIGMPRLATLGGKHAVLVWTEAAEKLAAGKTQTRMAGLSIRGR
jgi:hypothetical protein